MPQQRSAQSAPRALRVRCPGVYLTLRFDATQQRWLMRDRRRELMTFPALEPLAVLNLALGWLKRTDH